MANEIEFFEHPEYSEHKSDWTLYEILYEGDQDCLKSSQYLWPHELEATDIATPTGAPDRPTLDLKPGTRIRLIREQRSTYTNEIEPVISRWQSVFFKKDPDTSEVEELFGENVNDVTGEGESLNTFIKQSVLANRLIYGRPIIFTDAGMEQAVSLQDQRVKGLRPFFRIINPLEMKDWQMILAGTRKGQFEAARFEYEVIEPRTSMRQQPRTTIYSKELLFQQTDDKTGTYFYNKYRLDTDAQTKKESWVLVSSTPLSDFPNLPLRSIENEKSWIKDVAPLALKLFNLESGLDNIHLYQSYQRLFISGSLSEEQKKAMAEYIIGFLPDNAVVTSIEPVSTQSLENRIEAVKSAIRKVAFNQWRQVDSSSKAVEGADTQREVKEAITSLVLSELETLETLVNNAIKDYAFFATGKADYTGKVKFSKEIDVDAIVEEITNYNMIKDDLSKLPTWRKAILKKIARCQNLPEADEIIAEIDSANFQETNPSLGPSIRDTLLNVTNGPENNQTPA